MVTRRALLHAMFAAPLPLHALRQAGLTNNAAARLAQLETKHGGRLGVACLDLDTNRRIVHRADERFAMCSTFKLLVAGLVLARVDRAEERLDRLVTFSKGDLVSYSPITEKRVASGMTIAELCEAAMTISDNTAANLLLRSFGGPTRLTAYVRSLGFPKGWRVGDKTGTCGHASTNDIGVAWLPGRKPIIVTVYYDGSDGPLQTRERVIADVARIVAGS